MGVPLTDLAGRRFDRLIVLRFADRGDGGRARWLCRCDCGTEKVIPHRGLLAGTSRSCGCLVRQNVCFAAAARRKHGASESATYSTWRAMKTRCTNPNVSSYADYGARGITVCARWMNSFDAFLADMGERPPGTTIERTDNDRGYEPGNCKWIPRPQQPWNKRTNRVTPDDVHRIRERLATGESQAAIARSLEVPKLVVSHIANGRTWSALR